MPKSWWVHKSLPCEPRSPKGPSFQQVLESHRQRCRVPPLSSASRLHADLAHRIPRSEMPETMEISDAAKSGDGSTQNARRLSLEALREMDFTSFSRVRGAWQTWDGLENGIFVWGLRCWEFVFAEAVNHCAESFPGGHQGGRQIPVRAPQAEGLANLICMERTGWESCRKHQAPLLCVLASSVLLDRLAWLAACCFAQRIECYVLTRPVARLCPVFGSLCRLTLQPRSLAAFGPSTWGPGSRLSFCRGRY